MVNEIDRFWVKNRVWVVVLAAVVAILLNGGLRVLNMWLSPTGRVLNTVIFGVWVVQIGLFVLLVLNFVFRASQGADMTERGRTLYLAAGMYAVLGLLAVPVGNGLARPVQQQGFEAFIEENGFLVEAIERFEMENGEAPADLMDLHPVYLGEDVTQIEGEGEGAKLVLDVGYGSIDRVSGENVLYSYERPEGRDPWQLQVSIYLGSFQSMRFVYRPDGEYPNRYERVGAWAVDE